MSAMGAKRCGALVMRASVTATVLLVNARRKRKGAGRPKSDNPRPMLRNTTVAPETYAAIEASDLPRGRYLDEVVKHYEAGRKP